MSHRLMDDWNSEYQALIVTNGINYPGQLELISKYVSKRGGNIISARAYVCSERSVLAVHASISNASTGAVPTEALERFHRLMGELHTLRASDEFAASKIEIHKIFGPSKAFHNPLLGCGKLRIAGPDGPDKFFRLASLLGREIEGTEIGLDIADAVLTTTSEINTDRKSVV